MTGNRILSIATILVLLFLFTHPIDTDGDFFQHVNIGRYIVVHHAFPRADDLTFTAAGRPYTGYAWLSGLAFYYIYSTVGAVGINILVLGTVLLTFWLLYRYLRVIGLTYRISILTILVIAPVIGSRWPTRPEIFMYPIFLLFLLADIWKKKHVWSMALYPAGMLLLANVYGSSFPFAAGLLFLLAVKNWLGGERRLAYYAVMALSFPIALLNGYGVKSLLFIFLIPKMTTLWGDWIGLAEILKNPTIGYPWEVTFIYCIFIVYLIVLSLFSWKKLLKHSFYILLAAVVVLPFLAIRMRTLAAFFAAPLIGLLLSQIRSKWIVGATVLISSAMIVCCVLSTNPPEFGEYTAVFPPGLIQFMKTYDLRGNVFNTPRIGSFLSYYLAPQIRVFSDTRDDLFVGTGVLEATQAFLSNDASVLYLLGKYHVDYIVINLNDGRSFRDLVYDPDWALVYATGGYMIFVPRFVAREKNIPIFDTLDPYTISGKK